MLSLRCRAWLRDEQGNRWIPLRTAPMWVRCAERIGAAWMSVAYNRQYERPHSWMVARMSDCGENAVRSRLAGRWQLIDA